MKVEIKYPQMKCAYCGKTFTKTHNRQTYCSKQCSDNARKEKRRIYNANYYRKNRTRLHQTLLGTRTIGPHRHPEDEREQKIVQNEIDRLNLRMF